MPRHQQSCSWPRWPSFSGIFRVQHHQAFHNQLYMWISERWAFIVSKNWHCGCCFNCQSWKAITGWWRKIHNSAVYSLATQGEMASTAMMLTYLRQNISVSAWEISTYVLKDIHSIYCCYTLFLYWYFANVIHKAFLQYRKYSSSSW